MTQGKNIESEEILAMIRERASKISPLEKFCCKISPNWQIIFGSLLLGIIFSFPKTLGFLLFSVGISAPFCLVLIVPILPFIFLQLIIDDIGRSIARHIE